VLFQRVDGRAQLGKRAVAPACRNSAQLGSTGLGCASLHTQRLDPHHGRGAFECVQRSLELIL
jgi:hypothetical protein